MIYTLTDGIFGPELASSPPTNIQDGDASTSTAASAASAGCDRSGPAEGAVGQLPEVDRAPQRAEQPADQGRKKITNSMELFCLLQVQ